MLTFSGQPHSSCRTVRHGFCTTVHSFLCCVVVSLLFSLWLLKNHVLTWGKKKVKMMYMCVCVQVEARECPPVPFHRRFGWGFTLPSLDLYLVRLTVLWAPGIYLSSASRLPMSPMQWSQVCVAIPCFLHGCWGTEFRSSCLHRKPFTRWAILVACKINIIWSSVFLNI